MGARWTVGPWGRAVERRRGWDCLSSICVLSFLICDSSVAISSLNARARSVIGSIFFLSHAMQTNGSTTEQDGDEYAKGAQRHEHERPGEGEAELAQFAETARRERRGLRGERRLRGGAVFLLAG